MRIVFDFQPSEERPILDWKDRLPADFTIQRINTEIAEQLQRDLVAAGGTPWFDVVWGGIENFLKEGFGFAVLYEGAVVSNCRAWSVRESVAAIQVSTRMPYRQLGLATLVCSAFIEHCRVNGITPEYSCLEGNMASAALAEKLGFVRTGLMEDTSQ
jgi:RimJ/RimL family protein N-acetyltransferase